MSSPIRDHREVTRLLAESLDRSEIYRWLLDFGYFPESYVLPPCFIVKKRPARAKVYYKVRKGKFKPTRSQCLNAHFPKTEYSDRTFGIIHPHIHNDIAFNLASNWSQVVESMIPAGSRVTSYSFPLPIDKRAPGRLGFVRSGRSIYEFLEMTDSDLSSVAYRYSHIVRADIKNFYPSVYTHSIAWAIHGKDFIRLPHNLHNYALLGNRLDSLFRSANDLCTNGIPIGPVVSDIVAEILASAVDLRLTTRLKGIDFEAARFKDDYRVLVKSDADARRVVKALQASLKDFNLELSDEKTKILALPDGLFRPWVSRYHMALPSRPKVFTWKQFRELYIAVLSIDRELPGTGVVDRFLADISDKDGDLRLHISGANLENVVSMLLTLASLRVKAFPKVLAILERLFKTAAAHVLRQRILDYLTQYLHRLAVEEDRNKYLLSWLSYFLVSNSLLGKVRRRPKMTDPITKSVLSNRSVTFPECADFVLFEDCRSVGRRVSMFKCLDVFDPPVIAGVP